MPEATLRAARKLLEEMPAGAISVRELARTAGVSSAAPYRHFGDRAGFLVALAAECFGEFIDGQQIAYEAAEPGERLLQVGLAYVDYATEHPHSFALIFDPSISPGADPPESHLPLIDTHTRLLLTALYDAIETGRLSADIPPADLGSAMWSAAHGLAGLITSGRLQRADAPAILKALLT